MSEAVDRALWISWYNLAAGDRDRYLTWLHGSYIPAMLKSEQAAMREAAQNQKIEVVGAELRKMMPFLKKKKEAGVPEA